MSQITVGARTFPTVDDLEKLVIHAATQYELNGYVEDFDDTEVTDPEYDALFKELKALKPNSVAFQGTSPSVAQTSGDIVVHDPPMTSISKADGSEAEKKAIYDKWLLDCATRLGVSVDSLVIAGSYKRDGVAIRINYVKGKLKSAGLRPRDGVNGSDVTRHATNILGVPKELPHPYTLSLNGEVECHFEDFDKINAERDEAGEDQYKNPRNYTAGCLGRDDKAETKNARLRIAFYSITGFDEWQDHYKTEVERAKWANNPENGGLNLQDKDGKGFFVQIRVHKFDHLSMMEKHAKNLPYYTDGVVLRVNNLEQQEELGHVGDNKVNEPRGSLAWKYVEETAEAVVSSIEWNASRTGRVVPTAIFDVPFTLADTDNTRATCNNYGWMATQGLGPGAKVECKKGGKIIPNIMRVITPVTDIGAPSDCPSCGSKLHLHVSSSGNQDLLCQNPDCAAKHIKGWLFYIQTIGCKGLGASAMERVLNSGHCKSLADLYRLNPSDLIPHGFSTRQALLAVATIWQVKPVAQDLKLNEEIGKARKKKQEIEAWIFFAALGIHSAGKTAGKALVAHFKDFDLIRNASVDELQKVSGIGDTASVAIRDYFDKNAAVVDELLQFVELKLPKTGKLSGVNFVLTGSFNAGKKYWEEKIQEIGGNIQSSVGKTTNFLIQELGKNDGTPSDKEKKAQVLGVKVISIAELEKML